MTITERIQEKLTATFTPASLTVTDESEAHRGHGGYREGGETHFLVEIVSSAFEGKSRLERHRAVYAALSAEIEERVHALRMITRAPSERVEGE